MTQLELQAKELEDLVQVLTANSILSNRVNLLVLCDGRCKETLAALDELEAIRLSPEPLRDQLAKLHRDFTRFRSWYAEQNPRRPLGTRGLSALQALNRVLRRAIALKHRMVARELALLERLPDGPFFFQRNRLFSVLYPSRAIGLL